MFNFSFKDKNLKIVQKFGIFILISLIIIVAGAIDMFAIRGMNFGVEFSGGIRIDVTAKNADGIEDKIETWLNDAGYVISGDVQTSGNDAETLTFKVNSVLKDGTDLNTTVEGDTETLLVQHSDKISGEGEYEGSLKAYLDGEYKEVEIEVVTQVIGNDVKNYTVKNAIIAVSVAVAVILVYIAIRFTVLAGVAAILALLHDVLIMFALTCLFQIPVNMVFIAAVITIIGYSINATIVVFDRVRELQVLPSNLDKGDKDIANEAIASTMSRSILTTLTTLVMIVILAILGSNTIREFAYPIIFGLVAGAYSSVLLSASFWVGLRKIFGRADKKPVKKVKRIKETV